VVTLGFSVGDGPDVVLLKLLAFVLPLGVDSFAMAAALGTRRPTRRQRWRLSLLFVAFEGGMPLVGLAIGAPVASAMGSTADYIAGGVLVVVGLWMVFADENEDEAGRWISGVGMWSALALGASISLDELAIGFTLGLARLPVVPVIVAITVQALVASQLGFRLGAYVSEAWREWADRLAGIALAALGVYLVVQRVRQG
jgi:manganese efflux pump family protein